MQLDLIPVESVLIPDDYPRDKTLQANCADIIDSFTESRNLVLPIVVHHDEIENAFFLLKGSRRVNAALRCDLTHVPAIILTGIEHYEAMQIRAALHLGRVPISPLETARTLNDLQINQGLNGKLLCAAVGWGGNDAGRVRLGNYLRILNFPADVTEFFLDDKHLGIMHALQLQRLLPYPDYLTWVATKTVSEGLTPAEIHKLINQIERFQSESNVENSIDAIQPNPEIQTDFSIHEKRFNELFGGKLKIKAVTDGIFNVQIKGLQEEALKVLLTAINPPHA